MSPLNPGVEQEASTSGRFLGSRGRTSPHKRVPCPWSLGLLVFSAAEPHARPKPKALRPSRLADFATRSVVAADGQHRFPSSFIHT